MNQQDKSFLITFATVMAVLVLIAVAVFLAARIVSKVTMVPDDGARRQSLIEDRIKPVGQVNVAESSAEAGSSAPAQQAADAAGTETVPAATPPATGVDLAKGQEVYNSACLACHDTGAAGSPKKGDKAAWETRAQQDMGILVAHAIGGFNTMPAKGGNPNLSDDDVYNAVAYILSETGIQMTSAEPAAQEAAEPAAQEAAEPAAQEAAEPAAQETAPAEQESSAAASETTASAASIELPADLDLAGGKQLYDAACAVCHEAGVAGAPKLGDKAAWEPRLAQGWDTLMEHALKGFKGMPPKGGRMDASDQEIMSAVGYMISQ